MIYVSIFTNEYCLCCFLQDLGARDFSGEVYVVCQVVRVGRMLLSESGKKTSCLLYRRPYAVAIIKLDMEALKEEDAEVRHQLFNKNIAN